MPNIKLAFLEISPNTFSFNVYRKVYNGENIKDTPTIGRFRLPLTLQTEERMDYLVSFVKEDVNFELFMCGHHTNNGLTAKYVFYTFRKHLESNKLTLKLPKFQFIDRGFRLLIEFTHKEFQEGSQKIFLFPYYLKATNKFGFIVGFKFDKNDGVAFSRKIQQLSLSLDSNFKSNKNFYIDKFRLIDEFVKKYFNGFSFGETSNSFQIKTLFTELIPAHLEEKMFQFANGRTSSNAYLGLRSYGVLEPIEEPVKFLFLFQDKHRNFANDLFLTLLGKAYPDTFTGLEKMFQIPFGKDSVERITLTNESNEALNLAVQTVIKKVSEMQGKYKACVLYIETDGETNRERDNNPYLYIKYHFTKALIPLQTVDYTKHSKPNGLKYSAANIGLGIFAKLGGIPWKVKPKSENCLILGIGSAHKKNANDEITKYMAYSVCVDSSGIYKKLEILSEVEDEANYLVSLRKNLVTLLEKEEFKHYQKCALHIPSKIRYEEIEAIKAVVNANQNRELRVLKVNNDNKFFGVAEHATRVPYEGDYIQLSKNEYLLWFQGLKKGVDLIQGRIANPVHVEFIRSQNESPEQDYAYLQDLMNLSGANWRGFNARIEPISIYYAKLFADYAQKFESFPDFSPNDLNTDFPWFL